MRNKRKWITTGALAAVLTVAGIGVVAAQDSFTGDDDDLTANDASYEDVTAAALAETGGGTVSDVERGDVGGYEVEVVLDDGTELDVYLDDDFTVTATERDDQEDGVDGVDDDDLTANDASYEDVTAAALAETGGGTVSDVERGDVGGYEVEVVLDDGTEFDVYLDDDLTVTSSQEDVD